MRGKCLISHFKSPHIYLKILVTVRFVSNNLFLKSYVFTVSISLNSRQLLEYNMITLLFPFSSPPPPSTFLLFLFAF